MGNGWRARYPEDAVWSARKRIDRENRLMKLLKEGVAMMRDIGCDACNKNINYWLFLVDRELNIIKGQDNE